MIHNKDWPLSLFGAMKVSAVHIRLAVYLLLQTLCFALSAQGEATLRGVVVAADGTPLPYASIVAVSLDPVQGTKTDDKGRFTLPLPVDKALSLSVTCLGYRGFDTVMSFASGTTVAVRFVLDGVSKQLQTVKVTDEKSRTTTFTTVDIERVERNVGPQGGVEALIKTLPDVNSNNEMSSQYSVRGGSFDENLVYINNVEIYRPMLVRNGQQEGMSIINPDMVDNILFSPGGFDATYGDRMSSVLDITYSRPYAHGDTMVSSLFHDTRGQASASLLGATFSMRGLVGKRLSYSLGLRNHSNRYIFRSLDTKGNYKTSYSDAQALVAYKVSDALDLQLLAVATHNRYGLVPESQTTTFGGFQEVMQFEVYYEGEERDRYTTTLASLAADYHPGDDFSLRWTSSFQTIREAETYDILGQFFLYELNVGNIDENGNTERFDRGIGSYLEHARNYLSTNIFSTELRGTHYAVLGGWNWGLRLQYEQVRDRMREWRWLDSAGYAMPTVIPVPGDSANMPQVPMLQLFCRTNHSVATTRLNAFVQRNIDYYTDRGDLLSLVAGVRFNAYSVDFTGDNTEGNASNYSGGGGFDVTTPKNRHFFASPRFSLNYKPVWKHDILFRAAAGVYSQAPLYREYRFDDGTLNHAIKPQHSWQLTATMDWNFHVGTSPFKFTTDLYYKYITNLITYRIDNLRLRYDANNDAVGYATGLSLRISGEVVEGLESWASLSVMRTRQDVLGDEFGWLPRPTDQLLSFKIFFQDYVPSVPFWRVSLGFIVGSGLPFTYPTESDLTKVHHYPPYFRVDWGNTIQLSRFERISDTWLMRHVDDVLLSVEVFNLFDYKNVVSFFFVTDYNNQSYPVPNYLTARQINFKATVKF